MSLRVGVLLVVSGPSGSGKTTLCRRIADAGEAHYSVSCTTRDPRPGEIDGADYHFLSADVFQQRLSQGDFLEHAVVHGNYYGTLKSEVCTPIAQGLDVVMDIDVQGADQVRASDDPIVRRSFVDLFVMPRSDEQLRLRLVGRATDLQEIIDLRMRNALEEMAHWKKYQYRLLSGSREEDYANFSALLMAQRLRVSAVLEA